MGNTSAIHSVGASLVGYLRDTYPQSLRDAHPCDFRLFSSGELAANDDLGTTLSLYLYRVTLNPHRRAVPARLPGGERGSPLTLDLQYLLTVWSASAQSEQVILAWAMRQLHRRPLLDRSLLTAEADWGRDEAVQVTPSDLTVEEMMRIWDALAPNYRLSVGYTARTVTIEGEAEPDSLPVLASRFDYEEFDSDAPGRAL